MPSEIFQIWVIGTSTPLALCDLWTILRLIILQGSLQGLPGWPSSKGSAWYTGDTGSTPRSGRFPSRRAWHTLQYSCLENPMHRGAWGIMVYRVAKGQTQLKWLTTHACMCVCVCVCMYIIFSLHPWTSSILQILDSTRTLSHLSRVQLDSLFAQLSFLQSSILQNPATLVFLSAQLHLNSGRTSSFTELSSPALCSLREIFSRP